LGTREKRGRDFRSRLINARSGVETGDRTKIMENAGKRRNGERRIFGPATSLFVGHRALRPCSLFPFPGHDSFPNEKILTTDFTDFTDREKAPHEFIPFLSKGGEGVSNVAITVAC
jgi:hypothetical protein